MNAKMKFVRDLMLVIVTTVISDVIGFTFENAKPECKSVNDFLTSQNNID